MSDLQRIIEDMEETAQDTDLLPGISAHLARMAEDLKALVGINTPHFALVAALEGASGLPMPTTDEYARRVQDGLARRGYAIVRVSS